MTDSGARRCERCGRSLGLAGPAAYAYGAGADRRWIGVECLSYAEKDALLETTPRARAAAEREGRFTRAGDRLTPSAATAAQG